MNATTDALLRNAEGWASGVWDWMVPMALQIAILVTSLLILTWLLRNRTSARFRYALWLLVPARLILPPTLALATSWGWWCLPAQTSTLPVTLASRSTETVANETTPRRSDHAWITNHPPTGPDSFLKKSATDPNIGSASSSDVSDPLLTIDDQQRLPAIATPTIEAAEQADGTSTPGWMGTNWQLMFLGVWLTGTSIMLFRIACGMMQVRSLICRARPVGAEIRAIAKECKTLVGTRRTIAILVSRDVSTPMLVGLLHSTVLLPERIEDHLERGELRTVLVHEFQHVRRGDLIAHFLTSLLAAMYWFHPAVWVAQLQLRRLRELACDEGTVSALAGSRKSYAQGLVKVAGMISKQHPTPALGFVERKSEMNTRVMKILDSRLRIGRRLSVSSLVAVLAIGLILLPGAGRPAVSSAPRIESETVALSPAVELPSNEKTRVHPTSPQEAESKNQPESKPNQDENLQNTNKQKSPPAEMVVKVVDEDGNPLEGVNFFVNAVTRKLLFKNVVNDNFLSGDDGNARLKLPDPLLSAKIWASKPGYVTLFFNWKDGETDSMPDKYSLILQRGTEIGGIVVDSEGRPVTGAKVDVSLMGGGFKLDPQERTKLNNWLAEDDDVAVTDSDGNWLIHNAPAGDDLELRFRIVHPDFINDKARRPMGHYRVTLDELRAKTARFELQQGVEILGQVTDERGNPVSKALVVWGDRPYWEEGSQEVLTDDDGQYRIPPQPTGDVRITVVAKGWMPVDRVKTISADQAGTEDFQLEKGKTLRLEFVDGEGLPIPEVYVGMKQWHGVEALYNHRHPNVKDSGIPFVGDDQGNYLWTWAPGDLIKLSVGVRGWNSSKSIEVIANDQLQTIVLSKPFSLSGEVVDASTGNPINEFSIVPITYSSANATSRGIAQRSWTKKIDSRSFEFNDAFRVDDGGLVAFRFQAVGYRDFTTKRFASDAPDLSTTIRLKPAPIQTVRILNADGEPATTAVVWIACPDQGTMVNQFENYFSQIEGGSAVDKEGRHQFGSPETRHAVVAASRNGYAEKYLDVDEAPGDLVLRPWARLEGQLIQAGEPVSGATVIARPIRQLGGGNPHVQDIIQTTTDADGKFVFALLPPVPTSVRSLLTPWRDYPIDSSRELPIDLQPGQTHRVSLGGEGLNIVGKVQLTGDNADQIQFRYGLNRLLRLDGGITVPEHAKHRIEYASGDQKAWEEKLYKGIENRNGNENFFVKLHGDGSFLISGVAPGKYRFLIKLYEPPTGCLVEPVGYGFLEFSTDDYTPSNNQLDLGTLDVQLKPIPKVGETLADFRFKDSKDQPHRISDYRGKHVLIDFWASWCQPCIKALPDLAKIHNSIADNDDAVMIGISVDEDIDAAKAVVLRERIDWPVGFAGNISGKGSTATALGISTVPTYLVLDPEGKILYRGFSHMEAAEVLKDAIGQE